MKVSIDGGKCLGYGNCVLAAPDVLDLEEVTGKAYVLIEHPGDELAPDVEEAARSCPVDAVLVDRAG